MPAINEEKLRSGVTILYARPRRNALAAAIRTFLREGFPGQILPFVSAADLVCADIDTDRRSTGRSVAPADCRIAAMSRSRGMDLAIRNIRDFEDIGMEATDQSTAASGTSEAFARIDTLLKHAGRNLIDGSRILFGYEHRNTQTRLTDSNIVVPEVWEQHHCAYGVRSAPIILIDCSL